MANSVLKRVRHMLRPLRAKYEELLGIYCPKGLASLRYKDVYGKSIDWKHPKNIDEKINWMKFNYDTSGWTDLADKYRVRHYVEERGLGDILVPLYGKWDKAEDIDWDGLPNQFVMKTNHGSGDVLVCQDKTTLDRTYWTRELDRWMHTDYSQMMGEPHYANIKRCIIAEQLLDANKQCIESSSLIDFKVWAFDGKPMFIWCCMNRKPHSVEVITYDTNWQAHPEYSIDDSHYRLTDKRLPRPVTLDRMLEAAAILSKGHPQARVDFYEVDRKLFFGEMTMTSSAGINLFYTEAFRLQLGQLVKLPIDNL